MWNRYQSSYVVLSPDLVTGTTYVAALEYNGTKFRALVWDGPDGNSALTSDLKSFSGLMRDNSDDCGVGGAARTSFWDYNIGSTYSNEFDGVIGDIILLNSYTSAQSQALLSFFDLKYGKSFEYPSGSFRNGEWIYHEKQNDVAAGESNLIAAYPNPFSVNTTFAMDMATSQNVNIEILNNLGVRVAVIYNGILGEGYHEFTLDGNTLSNGCYIIKAVGDDFVQTGMVILNK
jgi:hypothetical protein